MKLHWITSYVAVNEDGAVKLADLDYAPEEASNTGDDMGGLYAAPISKTSGEWKPGAGELAIYATTKSDPILLGHMLDSKVAWCDGDSEFDPYAMWNTLRSATEWSDTEIGHLIRAAIPSAS